MYKQRLSLRKRLILGSIWGLLSTAVIIVCFPSLYYMTTGNAKFQFNVLSISGIVLIIVLYYLFIYHPNKIVKR